MAIAKKAITANRKKWVTALRSGKYKQGSRMLYKDTDNSFCCLGVAACELGIKLKDVCGGYLIGHLNPKIANVAVRLGLNLREHDRLINMNDIDQKDFNQIADWIEENLK